MSEEKKTVELKDENLEQVSGGTEIPLDPRTIQVVLKLDCSIKYSCPYTSNLECPHYKDNLGCKYDN